MSSFLYLESIEMGKIGLNVNVRLLAENLRRHLTTWILIRNGSKGNGLDSPFIQCSFIHNKFGERWWNYEASFTYPPQLRGYTHLSFLGWKKKKDFFFKRFLLLKRLKRLSVTFHGVSGRARDFRFVSIKWTSTFQKCSPRSADLRRVGGPFFFFFFFFFFFCWNNSALSVSDEDRERERERRMETPGPRREWRHQKRKKKKQTKKKPSLFFFLLLLLLLLFCYSGRLISDNESI